MKDSNMKMGLKIFFFVAVVLGASPSQAHEAIVYSFRTHQIYFHSGFPYLYWDDYLSPRSYQMPSPRPGSYALWKRNQERLTQLALAKMQAYSQLTQPAQTQPLPLEPEISTQPLPKATTVPQILWQPQTGSH